MRMVHLLILCTFISSCHSTSKIGLPAKQTASSVTGSVVGNPSEFLDISVEEVERVLMGGARLRIGPETATIMIIARAISLIDQKKLAGYHVLQRALERDDFFHAYQLLISMTSVLGRSDFHGHLAASWQAQHDKTLDTFLMDRIVQDLSCDSTVVVDALIDFWERSDGYFREDLVNGCTDILIWDAPEAVACHVDRLSPHLEGWLCHDKELSTDGSEDPWWQDYRDRLIAVYQNPDIDPHGAKKVIAMLQGEGY